MKNIFKTLLLLFIITLPTIGQIVTKPETSTESAKITTDEKRMSLGVDGNTLNFSTIGVNTTRNVGIGTFYSPSFSSPSLFINDAKLHIRHNSTTTNASGGGPQLILDEFEFNDFARLRFRQSYSVPHPFLPTGPSTYTRGARYWDIAGFGNGATILDDKLHFQNVDNKILTLRGDGNVGILNDNPTLPFHVNSSVASSNSSTGTAAIGPLTGQHILLDNNRINTYNNTTGTDLYLNDVSNGAVRVGSSSSPSNLQVEGFARLGGGTAPNIKMKKLTGTTSGSVGGSVDIAHAIGAANKILAIDIHVNYSGNSWVGPDYQFATSSIQYVYTFDNTNITIKNAITPNGDSIISKPISILITYEE